MSWPEDEVDFGDHHQPMVGDGLTEAELGAVIMGNLANEQATNMPDLGDPIDADRGGKRKIPCPGSEVPELSPAAGELSRQFSELVDRQDKLASSTLTAIEHLTERMNATEKKGTPIWMMSGGQKSACLFFGGWFAIFSLVFGARIIFHLLDMPFE